MCEAAVNRLKADRKRTVRGTLAVSGDSIKLTDDDTKALLLDQTIEKVTPRERKITLTKYKNI